MSVFSFLFEPFSLSLSLSLALSLAFFSLSLSLFLLYDILFSQHGDIEYRDDGKIYDREGTLIKELYNPDGTTVPINYPAEVFYFQDINS